MSLRNTCLAFLFLITLAACGSPPVATPPATPQPVFLAYPPELRPYADKLAACAREYPEISLYIKESVTEPMPDGQTSLFLALIAHPPALSGWNATLLAEDAMVVIVNQENPLDSLSTEQLRQVWNGSLPSWQSLSAGTGEIHIWTYPAGTALRTAFDSAVMAETLTSSTAYLAPDPQAALEAVAADAHAIGYLPTAWLTDAQSELVNAVHTLHLPTDLSRRISLPVLALTQAPPQGALRTLLLCTQD